MHALLVTLVALVLLRLLLARTHRGPRQFENVGLAIRHELSAWSLAIAALVGLFILVFVLALLFGPIPPIHEW
jgi:hypothetical protein